jgi:hypothetical protein
MGDIAAVAARLRGDRREVDDGARKNGRDDGITWAKRHATADELEQLAEHGAPARTWASLVLFHSLKESKRVVDLEIDANEERTGRVSPRARWRSGTPYERSGCYNEEGPWPTEAHMGRLGGPGTFCWFRARTDPFAARTTHTDARHAVGCRLDGRTTTRPDGLHDPSSWPQVGHGSHGSTRHGAALVGRRSAT